jgi:hypothetical protein
MGELYDPDRYPMIALLYTYSVVGTFKSAKFRKVIKQDIKEYFKTYFYYTEGETFFDLYGHYLEYEIKTDKLASHIELKAKNMICALWLCNIHPEKPDQVIENGYYLHEGRKYTFNNKTKKLKWIKSK